MGWEQTCSCLLWQLELTLEFCEDSKPYIRRMHTFKGSKSCSFKPFCSHFCHFDLSNPNPTTCYQQESSLILLSAPSRAFWGSIGDTQGTVSLNLIKPTPGRRTTCISRDFSSRIIESPHQLPQELCKYQSGSCCSNSHWKAAPEPHL